MLAVLDLDLRHVACSKAYAELMGEDASRLTGMSLRSLVATAARSTRRSRRCCSARSISAAWSSTSSAEQARVALHLAMVRRDRRDPRGVVLVAHAVPALSGG